MADKPIRTRAYLVGTQGRVQLAPEAREALGVTERDYIRYVIDGNDVRVIKVRMVSGP